MNINDQPENQEPASCQRSLPSEMERMANGRTPRKQAGIGKWLAVAGGVMALLVLGGAYALRGTLLWPVKTSVRVSFAKEHMAVEAASIPRVNGVDFQVSNETRERHQLVVFDESIPYRTKGFIEEWQPLHRDAGRTVEPGKSVSYQGIFVYEAPLKSGRHFLLFCNEPGHYGRGEHAELKVK